MTHWTLLSHSQAPADLQDSSQRSWDSAVTEKAFQLLLNSQTNPTERARLLAAAAAHSGDWLHAMSISACGLRLNDEAVRVAVSIFV